MIRAMILPTRCESPGLKGRKRTRDWSGLRTVLLRLTLIALAFMTSNLRSVGDRLLETRHHVLGQAHLRQR